MGMTAVLLAGAALLAAEVPLERIAHTSDPPEHLPTGGWAVGSGTPCSGRVVFTGGFVLEGTVVRGLYVDSPLEPSVIADLSVPVPDQPGVFLRASRPTCSRGGVVFLGDHDVDLPDQRNSLYQASLSDLEPEPFLPSGTVVDGEEILGFQEVDSGNLSVGIEARLSPALGGQALLIQPFDGPLVLVADEQIVLPGQVDPVTIFDQPVMVGEDLVFLARTQQNTGVYRYSTNRGFSVIADTQTPVPVPGGGNFWSFGEVVDLAGGLVLTAGFSGGVALFIEREGELEPLLLPGSVSSDGHVLGALRDPSGAGSLLSFVATPPGDPFLRTAFVRTPEGEILRVLGVGDLLEDGRQVLDVSARTDSETMVLSVISYREGDPRDSTSIYRARIVGSDPVVEVPAVSTFGAALLALGLAAAALRRLRSGSPLLSR